MREAKHTVNVFSESQFLVKRLVKGDEVAFNQFFEEYFPKLYRFALTRVGGNEDLAEELAQATMCKAMTRLKSWRGEAALSWQYAWFVNRCSKDEGRAWSPCSTKWFCQGVEWCEYNIAKE